ncbi:hypothetical protein CHH28_16900 [Bacterioplanes sanyensis]|uniref:Uncharacterized protein n=2 Tax=Bacterioplanes sanyensis TaxID=1249553 RepID=A0A222FPD7_9GAMM|nr:hypothetical protein CHH28_16900 [Bacterioplanes sanyensis]
MFAIPVPAWAQPELSEQLAAKLIDQALRNEPLLWLPFPLPYDVDRASRSKDAQLLAALHDHDLLVREDTMEMVTVESASGTRRQVRVGWRYDYPNETAESQTVEGFYYGRGRLKNIMELSPAYLIGDYYYAEAYIQWYVEDLQDWVTDPVFLQARTLRRSQESFEKPFEKRIFLMHNGTDWGFWQGQPGAL